HHASKEGVDGKLQSSQGIEGVGKLPGCEESRNLSVGRGHGSLQLLLDGFLQELRVHMIVPRRLGNILRALASDDERLELRTMRNSRTNSRRHTQNTQSTSRRMTTDRGRRSTNGYADPEGMTPTEKNAARVSSRSTIHRILPPRTVGS